MKETGVLAHCSALSLSLHQYARSPRVWCSDRASGAFRVKNWSVCQHCDAPLHPLMKCVPHPLSFVSVPLADGGAMFHMSVHWEFWRHIQLQRCSRFSSLQCSCPRRDSLHLHFLDAITLRRRPIAEIDAETQEVSNSGPVQQFCLFDHTWKFGPSSAIMHNEVAPERGLPPTEVAEVKWKLFSLIEDGLTRCWESNVSATRMFVLYVPSYLVFRCNGPDQEFLLVDQEHHVKRPEFVACGWIALRVLPQNRQRSDWITSARWHKKVTAIVVDSHAELWKLEMSNAVMHFEVAPLTTWSLTVSAFPQQCSIPECAWAFGCSPVLWRRCCWSNVSSPPRNLDMPWVN